MQGFLNHLRLFKFWIFVFENSWLSVPALFAQNVVALQRQVLEPEFAAHK
jgi:hypothetical protein